MPDLQTYSIKKNRFAGGFYPGFTLKEDGRLLGCENAQTHHLYLKAIDSGQPDTQWGRLTVDMSCSEDTICYVRVVALNEDSFFRQDIPTRIEDFLCDPLESNAIKQEFMERAQALRFVNNGDMLLYGLQGRYLYITVEIVGEGGCEIDGMSVNLTGDNFMRTFPQVYQERNGFFHRWISIFSSLYNDFDEQIGQLPKLLDVDACPPEYLSVYATWLGIDVGNDFLDESILRPLVREAYALNRMKGTKAALSRVAQIVLGERVSVLERNVMADYIDPEQMAEFERLYGDSVYDVTILVSEDLDEQKRNRLLFLLNQFKPVRARLHVICMRRQGVLDDYAYLDGDTHIAGADQGTLDTGQALDGILRLDE